MCPHPGNPRLGADDRLIVFPRRRREIPEKTGVSVRHRGVLEQRPLCRARAIPGRSSRLVRSMRERPDRRRSLRAGDLPAWACCSAAAATRSGLPNLARDPRLRHRARARRQRADQGPGGQPDRCAAGGSWRGQPGQLAQGAGRGTAADRRARQPGHRRGRRADRQAARATMATRRSRGRLLCNSGERRPLTSRAMAGALRYRQRPYAAAKTSRWSVTAGR